MNRSNWLTRKPRRRLTIPPLTTAIPGYFLMTSSAGLQRVSTRIPCNHNPFHYFDKTIIFIDTIKQDGEYRNQLENAWLDIIVIDEAHNVARRGTNSMRARVAELLSSRSDSLILL